MANTIKIKRSAVQNKTPTTSDIDLGELAINTYDGKLYLKKDDGTASIVQVGSNQVNTATLGYSINGIGNVIGTGIFGAGIRVPFGGIIESVTLLGDVSGSIKIDILKNTYANYIFTTGSICGASLPALSSASKYEDTTLSGWTTSFSAGDVFRFKVDSSVTPTSVTDLIVLLKITKASPQVGSVIQNVASIGYTLDGNGSVLSTGIISSGIRAPFSGTINSVTLLADVSGSVKIDILKNTYANYLSTTSSICASALPAISSTTKYEDTTLTGWTTSFSAGDVFRFKVDSSTTPASVTNLAIILKVTKA